MQTLTYGRAEDIRKLDIQEIAVELESLDLPEEIHSLWKRYLEYRDQRSAVELLDRSKPE